MPQISINNLEQKIEVPIPLTTTSGKIRIKQRSIINEYGTPVATRREKFKQNHYIEWQVGYDVIKKEISKLELTSLPNTSFIGANNKEKALYEISEYIWHFHKWGIVKDHDLTEVKNYLNSIDDSALLDRNPELQITRSHPINKSINGFDFLSTQVNYPLLIHRFDHYEIITEIKITEKQYAIGIQPMLYLCFPITELRADGILLGRTANTKEFAFFDISKDNIYVFVEMLKILGILSESHRHDVLQIISQILKQ